MRYLELQPLSQWTAALSNVALGHSRVLHGRVETYSMKRGGSDKKYAHNLGEKYVEQIQQEQEEFVAAAAAAAVASRTSGTAATTATTTSPQSTSSSSRTKTTTKTSTTTRKRSSSTGVLRETENKKDKDASNTSHMKRKRSSSVDQALLFPNKRPTVLGDFHQQATRRLMTDLILTLNASFPDYDFGAVKTSDFAKVRVNRAVATITHNLAEWARNQQAAGCLGGSGGTKKNVIGELWDAINEAISLKDCDVYRFQPPDSNGSLMTTWEEEDYDSLEVDHQNNGTTTSSTDLWSFYYLFVNKTQKRILLFTATETMKARTSMFSEDDDEDETEKYIGSVTDVEQDARFDLDPAASESIPISNI